MPHPKHPNPAEGLGHRLQAIPNRCHCIDPAWRGWMLRDGTLIFREGWKVTPGDGLSLPLLRAQIANYQPMERQTLGMDAQPQPGELPLIRA